MVVAVAAVVESCQKLSMLKIVKWEVKWKWRAAISSSVVSAAYLFTSVDDQTNKKEDREKGKTEIAVSRLEQVTAAMFEKAKREGGQPSKGQNDNNNNNRRHQPSRALR